MRLRKHLGKTLMCHPSLTDTFHSAALVKRKLVCSQLLFTCCSFTYASPHTPCLFLLPINGTVQGMEEAPFSLYVNSNLETNLSSRLQWESLIHFAAGLWIVNTGQGNYAFLSIWSLPWVPLANSKRHTWRTALFQLWLSRWKNNFGCLLRNRLLIFLLVNLLKK